MKKLIALTLAVVLIVSALPLTVFARTAEGVYNGYYYTATLTTTVAHAQSSMTYAGTTKIQSSGTVYYANTSTGKTGSGLMSALLATSSIACAFTPPSGNNITSANQSYYVFSTKVDYITVSIS